MNYKAALRLVGFFIGILIFSIVFSNLLLSDTKPHLLYYLLVHFAGYIFFLIMPVETIFLYYLTLDYNPLLLLVFALLTAILAQLVDFLIGLVFAEKLRKNYLSRKQYDQIRLKLGKHSKLIIFLFNLSPFSSPIIILIAGILKIRIDFVLIYSFLGLLLKYSILIGIYFA